jgi:hypothetical protein
VFVQSQLKNQHNENLRTQAKFSSSGGGSGGGGF